MKVYEKRELFKSLSYLFYQYQEISDLLKQDVTIEYLSHKVMETKDAKAIFYFTFYMDETFHISKEIKYKLAMSLIATKNAKYMYEFATSVSSAPITELREGIFNAGDEFYIEKFDEVIHSCYAGENKKEQLTIFDVKD